MRDVENAHFLHAPRGVEPVVQAPVDGAQAVDWLPGREELVVVCKGGSATNPGAGEGGQGTLAIIDPVMGTRTLATDLFDPGACSVSPDGTRVAVLERGRGVSVRSLVDGTVLWTRKATLLMDLWVGWWHGGVVAAGQNLDGRVVMIMDHQGALKGKGTLPKGAAVGVTLRGKVVLGRVTHEGAEIVPLTSPLKDLPPTKHRLRFSPGGVLFGVAEGGVAIWNGSGSKQNSAITVRCYGVSSAAVDAAGEWLAIGTRDGAVAVTSIGAGTVDRGHPDPKGGHSAAVLDIAFAKKGKWLATAGARCWIWSW